MPSRHFSLFSLSSSSSFSFVSAHDSQSTAPVKSHGHSSHSHTRIFGFELGFGVGASVSVFFFVLFLLLRTFKGRWKQNRASAKYLKSSIKLKNFAYRELKAATRGFDIEHKLGQGGFGGVYKGVLKGGLEVAVKKLDTASFQGEREFQNELSVIGHVCASPHIVRLVGFCSNGKKRLLVYEYMHNRSLQEALFDEDYPAQLNWERRFNIIVDTCKALAFLHVCEPPIIHGDIKPSNVLLDVKFCAKIADFGLARFKTDSSTECNEDVEEAMHVEKRKIRSQRYGDKERKHRKDLSAVSAAGAAERVKTQQQQEPFPTESNVRQSTSSVFTTSPDSDVSSSLTGKQVCDFSQHSNDGNLVQNDTLLSDSDVVGGLSPGLEADGKLLKSDNKDCKSRKCIAHKPVQECANLNIETDNKAGQLEIEKVSTNSGKEVEFVGGTWKEKRRSAFGRDWWWRQESSGDLSVKDYVMDWMGLESRADTAAKERAPADNLGGENGVCPDGVHGLQKEWRERREDSRSSEWWGGSSQEDGGGQQSSDVVLHVDKKGKGRDRDGRHWLKDDNSTLDACPKGNEVKPKDSSMRMSWRSASLEWWRDDSTEDGGNSLKSKKSCHKERPKSREWWKDEELTNSKEWKASKKKREHSLSREWSGELFGRGVSSTPSMRGTICYVAPENGSSGVMSEKSDIYSFGVLLLVIISGRRPLQVTASPITEFERANLISWARHLAHSGNVLELVDPSLNGEFCRKQATLSITVALLCLQRLPSKRPSMIEVHKMLSGELEAPSLPFHFSPSPPCRMPYRSRRCSLSSEGVTADFSISN
eukprot:c20706_g1_i1 orf=197-2653(-)